MTRGIYYGDLLRFGKVIARADKRLEKLRKKYELLASEYHKQNALRGEAQREKERVRAKEGRCRHRYRHEGSLIKGERTQVCDDCGKSRMERDSYGRRGAWKSAEVKTQELPLRAIES